MQICTALLKKMATKFLAAPLESEEDKVMAKKGETIAKRRNQILRELGVMGFAAVNTRA